MRANNSDGSAAVLVAVSLLVLLAAASFAIDIGLGFNERRDIQNAADNAALAAAFEQCNPREGIGNEDPTTAALEVAAENGFADAPPDVIVTPAAVPGSGGDWEVTIETTNATELNVSGLTPDQLTVTASATASCDSLAAPGPYAVFAGADGCPGASNELSINSSDVDIVGGVHSNGEVAVTGASIDILGKATHREGSPVGYSDFERFFGPPKPYPISVDISDFQTGGQFEILAQTPVPSEYFALSGNVRIADIAAIGSNTTGAGGKLIINQSGLYYIDGDLTFNKEVEIPMGVNVTFAVTGQIDFARTTHLGGTYSNFPGTTPATGIFLYSEHGGSSCTAPASIKLNGGNTGIQWSGTIFAPNGLVSISTNGASRRMAQSLGIE